jgi:hypothetical protein
MPLPSLLLLFDETTHSVVTAILGLVLSALPVDGFVILLLTEDSHVCIRDILRGLNFV